MDKTTWIIVIIIVALVVVVGGYFLLRGGYQAPIPAPAPPAPAPAPATPSPEVIPPEEVSPGAEAPPAVKEITVSGTEFSLSPSSITVSAGEKVRITFRNEGRIRHNLVIRDLGVGTGTIGPGQTETFEFTAPSSGTYTFICSVPGHAQAGMVGDLIVE